MKFGIIKVYVQKSYIAIEITHCSKRNLNSYIFVTIQD